MDRAGLWCVMSVVAVVAGCVPGATGGGGADGQPPAMRDAARMDARPVDMGPAPDGAAVDMAVAADDAAIDAGADAAVSDALPVDAAPADAAPDAAPPCEAGEVRPCPGCDAGEQACVDGVWGACVGADERCNGEDDDCDGAADEDFPELGEACGIGTGGCRGEGVFVCGMMGARCDARPGRPVNERCDGLDNDCDGTTDEDFALGDACEVGVGACARQGNIVCHPERLVGVCDAELIDPIFEVCDGADNDCDGLADEGFGLGAACAAGDGLCRNEGRIVCTADGQAACSAQAGDPAADELCNGLDDDCDGAADEGLAVGEACQIDGGECQAPGLVECGDDLQPVCVALPDNDELCNGADDDCDGLIDEDFLLGVPCQTGGGVCQAPGSRSCAPDGGVICQPDAAPVLGVGDGTDGALLVGPGERVVLEDRPYNVTALTVAAGGTVTVAAYDTETEVGGRMEIRVQGRLEVAGTLELTGLGFPGGPANPKQNLVYAGQWTNNGGTTDYHGMGPGGGGGGFAAPQVQVGSGGGGGHAAAGAAGARCGADNRDFTVWDVNTDAPIPIAAPPAVFSSGGQAYGDPAAGAVTRGSGGGSGGNNYDGGPAGVGGAGGAGGGALLIVAAEVAIDGTIRVDGAAGAAGAGGTYLGGGGGGAGGSVYIAAPVITIGGVISSQGGGGAAGTQGAGGRGGVGWIRLDAGDLQNGGAVQPAPTLGAFDCALPE